MRMIQRIISIILLLMILFFVVQWGVTYLKKSHEIIYDFVTNDETFEIKENYRKDYGDMYYVEISLGDEKFYYTFKNDFQKKKKIISDIKMVKNDQLVCIYPILEKGNHSYDIECSSEKKLYSYESMKNDPTVQEFVQMLKKDHINLNSWEEESDEEIGNEQSTAYQKNILEEDKIIVWYYQGIEIFSSAISKSVPLLDWDKYENKHGVLVGKYYLIPTYQSNVVFDFSKMTIVDVTSSNFWTIDFPQMVSQNTYINGVVDGKVYYLDKDHVIQYELNPEQRSIRTIGNQELDAQYYNGTWETVNIYDLINNERKFEIAYTKQFDFQRDDIQEIFESNGSFYYYTQSGDFYQVLKFYPNSEMFLFHVDNPSSVIVNQNTIYYIKGDTLYFYKEGYGNRKVVKNNEFLYNPVNRVQIYKESKS